jgi:hypothetical protein
MHNINVNNLSAQNHHFLLHDEILFLGHGKSQAQDLRLGVLECKVYHYVSIYSKYQIDFDPLCKLHVLNKNEEDNDMSWECCKVVEYFKENRDDHSSNHRCLEEWNGIHKTKSRVIFSSSLSNSTPIISFEMKNKLLDKMLFSPQSVL